MRDCITGYIACAVFLGLAGHVFGGEGDSATQPIGRGLPAAGPLDPRPAVAAGTYLRVPVSGVIGKDFTAGTMRAYLALATKLTVTTVLLDVDTPGGSVPDAEAITALIVTAKGYRFVAMVRRALSAGVPIVLACQDIYFAETGMLGAATSYMADARGEPVPLPRDIAEKHQSAWRGVCRLAAQHGGHPSILAEGMVDADFALTMRKVGGRVVLERDGSGEVLKARGHILTLTAKEAILCGLAQGIYPNAGAAAESLRMTEAAGADGDLRGEGELYQELFTRARLLTSPALTGVQKDAAGREWDAWYKDKMRECRGKKVRWTLSLAEAEKPQGSGGRVLLSAVPWGNKQVRIEAWVTPDSAKSLASVPKGEAVTISGTLTGVTFSRTVERYMEGETDDGVKTAFPILREEMECPRPEQADFTIRILLKDCTIGGGPMDVRKTEPAKPRAVEPPESQARQRLALARTYSSNGLIERAMETLRGIVETYPGTSEAQQAAAELKRLAAELKGRGTKEGKD